MRQVDLGLVRGRIKMTHIWGVSLQGRGWVVLLALVASAPSARTLCTLWP